VNIPRRPPLLLLFAATDVVRALVLDIIETTEYVDRDAMVLSLADSKLQACAHFVLHGSLCRNESVDDEVGFKS